MADRAAVKSTSDDRRQVARPNSFIFTLYGDMVHRGSGDGSLWIGGLIRLMASFGVSAAAVRQAVSRHVATGVADRPARGEPRVLLPSLCAAGGGSKSLSPRIYGPVIEWDGRWRLLTYAIGEARREAPRATAEGTERAGLGAALADDLDIARRHARRRARGGRRNRDARERSIFLRANTEDRGAIASCSSDAGMLRRSPPPTATFIARYEPRLRPRTRARAT